MKKNYTFHNHRVVGKKCRVPEHGAALILTLLVVAMLTVVVVSFNASTRTEQMASRNYSLQSSASGMADIALAQALSQLAVVVNTNTNANRSYISQPGRILLGGTNEVLLSSDNSNAVGQGMSKGTMITNFGHLMQINASSNSTDFDVPWINVQGDAWGKSGTNIGRFAFWIDDNGVRANLNQGNVTSRSNYLPYSTKGRPLDLRFLTAGSNITDFSKWISSSSTNVPWGYIFTPRQFFGLIVGAAAANTNAPNLPQFTNYYNFAYQAGGMNGNTSMSNDFSLAEDGVPGVLSNVPSGSALGALGITGNSETNLIASLSDASRKYFMGGTYDSLFGNINGFSHKYGLDLLYQIIANINDAYLTNGNTSYFLGSANTTNGKLVVDTNLFIPTRVFGLRPTPFLNEIGVGVAISTNSPAVNAEIQVWVQAEVVDPYHTSLGNGWIVKQKIKSLVFNGRFQSGTNTVEFKNNAFSAAWNWDGTESNNTPYVDIANIPSESFYQPGKAFVFQWQLGGASGSDIGWGDYASKGISNIVLDSVEVIMQGVALYSQVPPRRGNSPTIRDWAYGEDFSTFKFSGSMIKTNNTAYGYSGSKADSPPSGIFTKGIAKNDPRVKTFASVTNAPKSWFKVGEGEQNSLTLGYNNSIVNFTNGTGLSGIANDRVINSTSNNIYMHPSFYNVSATNAPTNWTSAFDLSRVHTGLQWRTLQFRAQDKDEAAKHFVPDWALLGALTVANTNTNTNTNTVLVDVPRININAVPIATKASIANLNIPNMLTNGTLRYGMLASLLAGNTNNPTNATNPQGVNFQLPTNAKLSNSNEVVTLASNIATMTFSEGWKSRREGDLKGKLPQSAYVMPAEAIEALGVADLTNQSEEVNEARVRGFYDAITISSDSFTVFLVGQALDKKGQPAGEVRRRVVVEKVSNTNNGTITTTLRPVYTEILRDE